eukprot:s832_g8.t1
MGPGRDAAALEAANTFRAKLVGEGFLTEPKLIRGVRWHRRKWEVEIKVNKKRIYGGQFTDKAAAEAKAFELREQHKALVRWEQNSHIKGTQLAGGQALEASQGLEAAASAGALHASFSKRKKQLAPTHGGMARSSEAEADAAALEAAKAFRAKLVGEGLLSEPKDSKVRGVRWHKMGQKWLVQIKANKKTIYGGLFMDKAAAEAKALELREQHSRPLWTLPMFDPKVPNAGVTWEQRSQQWCAECKVAGVPRKFYSKRKDLSEAELDRSFQAAMGRRKKQEMENEGKAEPGPENDWKMSAYVDVKVDFRLNGEDIPIRRAVAAGRAARQRVRTGSGSLHAMAGKKIIKKGKKAGGKIVAGDGEKGSPKVSPKTSPKLSPKLSPKESPKTSPKLSPKEAKKAKKAAAKAKPDAPAEANTTGNAKPDKPGKAPQKAPPSTQEKEKATTEVIRIIKEALKNPEAQKKGFAWTPKDWPIKWKPILGGYRRFVERCACFQVVPSTSNPTLWTISVVEGAEGAITKAKWEIELRKAYVSFLQTNQDPKEFTQLAQALASAPKSEGAPKGEKRKAETPAKSEAKKKARNKMNKAKKGKGGEA